MISECSVCGASVAPGDICDNCGNRVGPTAPAGPDSIEIGLLWTVVIGIPVLIGWVLVTGLGKGGDWLANDSPLAWLFPGPGASLASYVILSGTLLLVVSGGLFAAAALLGDRLTPLRRLVLVPLAVLSVPMVLFATVSTTMR
jgi:hypothetical protein